MIHRHPLRDSAVLVLLLGALPAIGAGCGDAAYECADWENTGALICVWSVANLTKDPVSGKSCPTMPDDCKPPS